MRQSNTHTISESRLSVPCVSSPTDPTSLPTLTPYGRWIGVRLSHASGDQNNDLSLKSNLARVKQSVLGSVARAHAARLRRSMHAPGRRVYVKHVPHVIRESQCACWVGVDTAGCKRTHWERWVGMTQSLVTA